MKIFKFSLLLRTRENTDVFITLDDNVYGIHSKRVNILYMPHSYGRNITAKRYIMPQSCLRQAVGCGGGGHKKYFNYSLHAR